MGKFKSLLDYFAKMTTLAAEEDQRTRSITQASHTNDLFVKCVFDGYLTAHTEPRDVKYLLKNIQEIV